ncbi:Pimeloyl-ACP methyl ester carboxylesterase [Catalinimonas alkaloidigena]|uniref:Pimeloyl-ACP methyl ester carboxylesterase n=1 Tax=Catalinimonas alkaloidigena TaxID=1075417 RepID=A0A1G9DY91_9BACT|nr:alpha/beta hydrolase [Catalinimonas alkaloidigena]SDK68808.1 Pimeloyl-ACP methyl ester carboxylesterase [Catalinimonas alkaloidigena]
MSLLSYTDVGSGPTVVLLHGFCESRDVWAAWVAPLQNQFRFILLDLPGHGDNPPVAETSMEAMAEAVAALMQELTPEPFVLIGHSMGGYVALAFAEHYPERLCGLGLFHSTAYPDSAEKKEARNKTVRFLQEHGVQPFIDGFVHPLFHFKNRSRLTAEMDLLRTLGRQTPQESVMAAALAMRDRPDRRAVLQQAPFPVLFIAGRDDKAVDFDASRDQYWLPAEAYAQVLPETAHKGMFERPAETRAMVAGFATRCFATRSE